MAHAGVRELDLSNCTPSFVADRVGVAPGLRCSAAFFTFLRANLVLTPSAISSPGNTPYLEPYSPQLPPYHQLVNHNHQLHQQHSRLSSTSPSTPSPLAAQPLSTRHRYPDDDVPPLSLDTLATPDDKAEGLRLVADSVAQMRPRAARVLARHPLVLAALASAWALVCGFVHASRGGSAGLALPLGCIAVAAYLLAVRLSTAGYDKLAESIDVSWLQHPSSSGHEDVVLGARRGGILVGALVLRIEPRLGANTAGSSSSNGSQAFQYLHRRKNRSRSASFRGGRGVIRAWTTLDGRRGEGIGRELLHAAVRRTRDVCGRDAQVGFAKEHANSVMLLPDIFTAPFKHDERRAAESLQAVVDEWDVFRRKKR
ncbi:GCN5-related N-acetyltransferase (GNAT) domain-containingprotein [Purpureocillium lavendulum]|uniref:GCN5-related N-acetyltransferase (GNAT) domain-containingprotein n=1 Tax=Purpureocillium lavendulum TaxID=1247861 RepID=A0AB34G0D1_9HYPO|nr:GCN5-related N-acetyltransferase (GNAT) domain-containingprotein [Purpureocillium lavendulum]